MRNYYELTKPGIIYGNALPAFACFFFASHEAINWALGAYTLLGLSLVVASACVTNNYLDQDIDGLMERTKNRALPLGLISLRRARIFGDILGVLGIAVLFFFTNLIALWVAVFGWLVYVAAYSPLKRHTPYALFVGAVAGAVPPVVGYVAVTNTIDFTAFLLFAFLFLWQIPHFLAIAVYRYSDYVHAGIPLFIKKQPSEKARALARATFYASLAVLLVWCAALMLQR